MTLQTGDREQIEARRREQMRRVLEARALDRWPNPCPTCFAIVGQACLTINGKRAQEHNDRHPQSF